MPAFRKMSWFTAAASLALAFMFSTVREGRAQIALGTAFTYQGSLTDGGVAANGAYDFEFKLYDADTAGNLLGTVSADDMSSPLDDVAVTQGVFTVSLDFGDQFDGNRRWLEIRVRPGADVGPGGFTMLTPRIELTAAPHALYAVQAGNASTADSATTAGSATNAANATNADDADLLDGMDSSEFATPSDVDWTVLMNIPADFADDVDDVDDADADATNELNTGLALAGTELRIGDAGGTVTAELASLVVDRAPIAVLETDVHEALANSPIWGEVNFDLSLGYDPEGETPEYGFDPEGRTSGEPSYAASATMSYTYTEAGTYLAEGWVRDSSGQYDVDKAIVEVFESGGGIATGPTESDGRYISLAVVNGRPAVSFRTSGFFRLGYLRADDADGTSWTTPVTVDSDGGSGSISSLAVVNGFPAIAAYDSSGGLDLNFYRAADEDGTSWSAPITVDSSSGNVGQDPFLAVVNGNPAISYRNVTGSRGLKYARADDADGTTWSSTLLVDGGFSNGEHTSLAVVDGNPAISYEDGGNGLVKYARADDADGTAWSTIVSIDTIGSSGVSGVVGATSLAVVNGRPAIAYFDLDTMDLNFARADDADGTTWSTIATVDGADDVGAYASLAVIDGRPAIAYYDVANGDLKYALADDADGTSWSTIVAVDPTDDVGAYCSLALVNGYPLVAYYDATNGGMKFAR